MAYNHQQHYGQQEGNMQVYPDYGEYADIDDPAVAESRSSLFSASQPLFTREEINNTRTLDPYQTTQSPQSWPTYEPPFQQRSHSYAPYPSPSPFPPPRLSPPPPVHHQAFHFKAQGQSTSPNSASHRLTLAGSLDPATGIFYRTPEHPRLRTAQACEKCRTRKAKCSGEHPSCKRCITRGLICEYAKEGRVRGPNKPKPKNGATSSPSGSASIASTVTSRSKNNDTTPTNTNTGKSRPASSRHRNSSSHSSAGSSDQATKQSAAQSLQLPPSVGERNDQILHGEHSHHPSISGSSSPTSSTSTSASRGGHRSVVGHSASGSSSSRRNSLGEHRPSRPRPPDLHLSSASTLFRLSGGATGEGTEPRSGSTAGVGMGMGDMGPGMGIGSPGIGQGTAGGDSVFYPLRHHTQPPQQHQHRTGPSQGYTPDPLMGRIGQHQSHQYQQPHQHQHQQIQIQHNLLVMQGHQMQVPSQGSEIHPLTPSSPLSTMKRTMSVRTEILHGQRHAEHFPANLQLQQQQHSLVPIHLGLNVPGEEHEPENEEFMYPHPGVLPFFQHQPYEHPTQGQDHHEDTFDSVPRQQHHEYRQREYSSQREPEYGERQPYEPYQHHQKHHHRHHHLGLGRNSPRTTSTTSASSALGSGSPLTPISSSTSSGIPIYNHVQHPLGPGVDPDLGGVSMSMTMSSTSASTSSSLSSVLHGQGQSQVEGDLHGSHGGIDSEQRGGSAAVHRGNGLSGGSLSNLNAHGHSPTVNAYANATGKLDTGHDDEPLSGYPAMDLGMC